MLQGACLVAFILVSRTEFAPIGKPIVLACTFLGVLVLLWFWIDRTGKFGAFVLAPVSLAIGYAVAYHAVGALWFSGLLKDFYPPYFDYALEVLGSTAMIFVFYWVAAAMLFGLQWLRERRRYRPPQRPHNCTM
jgi:glucan phosphoethanolaminetransferase (alkaline phosphatase superfamily)